MKIEDPFLSSLGINWEMIFVQTQGKVCGETLPKK